MGRARNWLIDQAEKAEQAGHRMQLRQVTVTFSRARRLMPSESPAWQAVCACGWEGRPLPKKGGAALSIGTHLGSLSAEGFPTVDEWRRHAHDDEWVKIPPEYVIA